MAGHGLLPGCQVPWRHPDCPGVQPASTPGGFDAVVCHCPCHALLRALGRTQESMRSQGPPGFFADEEGSSDRE